MKEVSMGEESDDWTIMMFGSGGRQAGLPMTVVGTKLCNDLLQRDDISCA